jgi:hypothetical protein
MKSITEQVDEFIESFFDGSINPITAENAVKLINSGFNTERVKIIMSILEKITDEYIPQYLNSENEEKEKNANRIYLLVLKGRRMGYFLNNPDKLKELNWYKSENERLKKENAELKDNVTDLTKKFMAMTPTKDEKVGIV